MKAAGADVTPTEDGVHAACRGGRVRAFTVDCATAYGPSLGATASALLLAARAPGTSLITSPSVEPEVTETTRMLSAGGVGICWDAAGLRVTSTTGNSATSSAVIPGLRASPVFPIASAFRFGVEVAAWSAAPAGAGAAPWPLHSVPDHTGASGLSGSSDWRSGWQAVRFGRLRIYQELHHAMIASHASHHPVTSKVRMEWAPSSVLARPSHRALAPRGSSPAHG